MTRAACFLLCALFLAVGCGQPEPTLIQVGPHGVSLVFPADWEHFDYGEKHLFRKDFERISLEDMGTLGSNVDRALEKAMVHLREDGRREIASRDSLEISGRQARVIDTWDHVSHQYRKRYLFVVNDRSLLALYMMNGRFELMEPAFEGLKTSLAFADSLGVPGNSGPGGGD